MRAVLGDLVGGRYRLERLVEVEDSRRTYTATDTRRGRTVEVRVLDGPDPGAELIAEMRAEGEALARCREPDRVACVVELPEWRDEPVIVTECVPGRSVTNIIRTEAPRPAAQAVAIGRGLVEAMLEVRNTTRGRLVHRSAVVSGDDRGVVVTGLRSAPRVRAGSDPAVAAISATVAGLLTARVPEPGEEAELPGGAGPDVDDALRHVLQEGLRGRIRSLDELRQRLVPPPPSLEEAAKDPFAGRDVRVLGLLVTGVVALLLISLLQCVGSGGGDGDGGRRAAAADAGGGSRTVRGLEIRAVPDLRGLQEDEATSRARDAGYDVHPVRAWRRRTTAGQVDAQRPAAGRRAPEGSIISITVSRGPPPVRVPDVRGLPLSGAREVLQSRGLRIGGLRAGGRGPEGAVVVIRPRANALVQSGSEVELTLAGG